MRSWKSARKRGSCTGGLSGERTAAAGGCPNTMPAMDPTAPDYAPLHRIGWPWAGAAEDPAWQALASIIAFFLGGPSDIRGGILVDALRICLVAAVVEQASAKRVEALSSSGRSEDCAVATPAG